ncbi:uncharacterized protein LTR77_006680 [Saxophila tyrrhenica]|uniref:Uncharacterized protein n=1 Tax=Saxophila tyrrhenica TaxID=1690608 RepID=A0AAV9P5J1_9PEZI|nr:hypothetical protein LTR77_006680 [Saxophila tyrrhenica]
MVCHEQVSVAAVSIAESSPQIIEPTIGDVASTTTWCCSKKLFASFHVNIANTASDTSDTPRTPATLPSPHDRRFHDVGVVSMAGDSIFDDEWDAFRGSMTSMDELGFELDSFYGPDEQALATTVGVQSGHAADRTLEHEPATQQDQASSLVHEPEQTAQHHTNSPGLQPSTAENVPQPDTFEENVVVNSPPRTGGLEDAIEGVETAIDGHDVASTDPVPQLHLIPHAQPATTTTTTTTTTTNSDPTAADQTATQESDQAESAHPEHFLGEALARDPSSTGGDQQDSHYQAEPVVSQAQPHTGELNEHDSNNTHANPDSVPEPADVILSPSKEAKEASGSDELAGPVGERFISRHDSIVESEAVAEAGEETPLPDKQTSEPQLPVEEAHSPDKETQSPVEETQLPDPEGEGATELQEEQASVVSATVETSDRASDLGDLSVAARAQEVTGQDTERDVTVALPINATDTQPQLSEVDQPSESIPAEPNTEQQEAKKMPAVPLRPAAATPKTAVAPNNGLSSSIGRSSMLKEMRDEDRSALHRPDDRVFSPLALKDSSGSPVVPQSTALTEDEFQDVPTPQEPSSRKASSTTDLLENVSMAQQKAKAMARRLSESSLSSLADSDVAEPMEAEADDPMEVDEEEPQKKGKKGVVAPKKKPATKKAKAVLQKKAAAKKGKANLQSRQNTRKAAAKEEPQDTKETSAAGVEGPPDVKTGVTGKRKRAPSQGSPKPAAKGRNKKKLASPESEDAMVLDDPEVEAQVTVDDATTSTVERSELSGGDFKDAMNGTGHQPLSHVPPSPLPIAAQPKKSRRMLAELADHLNDVQPEVTNGREGRRKAPVNAPAPTAQASDPITKAAKGTASGNEAPPMVQDQQAPPPQETPKRQRYGLSKLELTNLSSPLEAPPPSIRAESSKQETPKPEVKKKTVGRNLMGKRELAAMGLESGDTASSVQTKERKTRAKAQVEAKAKPDAGAAVKARRKGKGV